MEILQTIGVIFGGGVAGILIQEIFRYFRLKNKDSINNKKIEYSNFDHILKTWEKRLINVEQREKECAQKNIVLEKKLVEANATIKILLARVNELEQNLLGRNNAQHFQN